MGVSIKLCYHPSVIKGKDGTLYYQIIIKRTTHTYTSGYRIYPNDWDKRHGRILTNRSSLIKIKNRTYWEMQQIYRIAKRHIDKGTPLDFGGIISEFEELNRQQSFSGFLLSQAERLADMDAHEQVRHIYPPCIVSSNSIAMKILCSMRLQQK